MIKPSRRAVVLVAALALSIACPSFALAQTSNDASAPRVLTPRVDIPSAAPVQDAAAAAPAPTETPPNLLNEGVAAIVNDDVISTYDLRQRMRLLVLTTGMQPTEQTLPQLEQEALRSLIDERLQMQELQRVAKKQKDARDLIASDREVDQELGDLAKQNNLSAAQMRTSFAASGINIDTMRDQIRAQMSWQRLVSGMYSSYVRVGEDQVDAAIKRISDQASQTQYLMSEIFLDAAHVGGMSRAIDGANQLIRQMQEGAPFNGVAREFSDASTKANGGDAGWVTAAQVQPEVAKALETLRPGQLSMPIPVADGVYVIYLRQKQAASGQTVVSLKQLAVRLDKGASEAQVAAAAAKLAALKPQITSCNAIDSVAAKAPGVISADLGEADINDLRGPFRDAAEKLNAGQVSDPIRTDVGVHLVAICLKRAGDAKLPSRAEISNRLYAEQISVMSRRYLRDLRNSATIEAR